MNEDIGEGAVSRDDRTLVAFTETLRPARLTPEERARLKERILVRACECEPEGSVTLRAREGHWEQVSQLVRVKVQRDDFVRGERTFIIELQPGARYPAHYHEREEASLMLEGEMYIGDLHLRRGDLHLAPAGSWHAEVWSPTGAVCFVRAAIPRGTSA
jgi:quercetin dioxygenase-like cupin family protein